MSVIIYEQIREGDAFYWRQYEGKRLSDTRPSGENIWIKIREEVSGIVFYMHSISGRVQNNAPEGVTTVRLSIAPKTDYKDEFYRTQRQLAPEPKPEPEPEPEPESTKIAAHSSREFRTGKKQAPNHLSQPFDIKEEFYQYRVVKGIFVNFKYAYPKNAIKTAFQRQATASEAQAMLTRNGLYKNTFFNSRTTDIEVTTYNDPDDANEGPQYMIFTFRYNSDTGVQPTIIVNYDNYIAAFTFNIDYSNKRNPKYLVMPRTIKYGIGRFYEDEHTNFRFGEDDKKRFSLITFTWSDQ